MCFPLVSTLMDIQGLPRVWLNTILAVFDLAIGQLKEMVLFANLSLAGFRHIYNKM